MKRTRGLAMVSMLVLGFACTKDFVDPNLTKEQLIILAPVDKHQTVTLTQTFWWEELDGANKYQIQVVTPDFATVNQLLVDTNVSGDNYIHTFVPGTYQWRIRATNTSSQSPWQTYDLTILSDSTGDLSQQIIVLVSPLDNSYTNNLMQTLDWDTLSYSDEYRLEISTPDFASGTPEISPQVITTDSYAHTFSAEGAYEWRVRAQNATSNTAYTTFSLEVDTTRPNTPTLISPLNNAFLNDSTHTLFWDRGVVTGSPITDSLHVYSDSLMTNMVLSISAVGTSYADSLGIGVYFWHVRSEDAATNQSNYSVLNKFTIQ